MSNLVEHAKFELEKCGQFENDPAFAQSLVATVAAFASYGHSGGSAGIGIEMLYQLLRFKVLSPLTSDPEEWFDHSEKEGEPLWQSKRQPNAFSKDGGKSWYYV